MRFSFFDEVGMPSRWRAREMERKKQLEEKERGDENNGPSDKGDLRSESANELLEEIQSLIVQRESEISILEEKTKTIENEIFSFHQKISDLQNEHEHGLKAAKSERDAIIKAIQLLGEDNEKLDEKLLETGVILEEKDMCYHLLEEELREARNELYELQSIKKANKKKNGGGGRTSSAPQTEGSDEEEQVDMQVLLNDVEGLSKKDNSSKRLPRRGSSNSFVSALTIDFDDIIDILDASRHNDYDDLDNILDSFTSSKNSSSISG
jgi:DNA repair exonuclease SbcCD ATPase subunit